MELTVNERLNRGRYNYLKSPNGAYSNPFDEGCVKNSINFFFTPKFDFSRMLSLPRALQKPSSSISSVNYV